LPSSPAYDHRPLPVAFVLAGGYLGPSVPASDIVALHRLTLAKAAPSKPTGCEDYNVVRPTRIACGRYVNEKVKYRAS
jgi:hypothetical protein